MRFSKRSVSTPSASTEASFASPIVVAGVISRSAARARSRAAASSIGSGIELVGDLAQHSGDLLGMRTARVATAAQVTADVVQQLHEVFDDDRHVVGRLASSLGKARRGFE